MASKLALKRLTKEFRTLQSEPDDWFRAHWDVNNGNILLWYFAFRGSVGSPYEGGVYVGKLVMSPMYPFKPPDLYMITPSGRFKPGVKICTTFSSFHPDMWGAGWPVKSMVMGMQSFMMDESDPSGIGGLFDVSENERRELAGKSHAFNRNLPAYNEYFDAFDKLIRDK